MTKSVYKFKNGFSGNAEETYHALEDIREKNDGRLIAGDVVQHAEPESSPLHRHFEWDDAKAGHSWRKHTARVLIKSVSVVTRNVRQGNKSRPAYINVVVKSEDGEKDRYYQNVDIATTDEFASAIEELNNRIESLAMNVEKIETSAGNREQKKKAKKIKTATKEFSRNVKQIIVDKAPSGAIAPAMA